MEKPNYGMLLVLFLVCGPILLMLAVKDKIAAKRKMDMNKILFATVIQPPEPTIKLSPRGNPWGLIGWFKKKVT